MFYSIYVHYLQSMLPKCRPVPKRLLFTDQWGVLPSEISYCCEIWQVLLPRQNSDWCDHFCDVNPLVAFKRHEISRNISADADPDVKFHSGQVNISRHFEISLSLTIRSNDQNCHKEATLTTNFKTGFGSTPKRSTISHYNESTKA